MGISHSTPRYRDQVTAQDEGRHITTLPCGCIVDSRNPGGRLKTPCEVAAPIVATRKQAMADYDAAKATLDAANDAYWAHYEAPEVK